MKQGNDGHDGQADDTEHDRQPVSEPRTLVDRAEPLDAHRYILDAVRSGPVSVATLTGELYGVPGRAAWAVPWRARVIAAVNALAERGRLGWTTVDGEPAATLTAPAELPDPGPAAAVNAAQAAPKPLSRPQPSPPVRGPREARLRRVRLAADRARGVEDVQLP